MGVNNKILLDVPYYSQWLDVKDADWRRRSCGIAALKMAMLALRSPRRSRDEEGDVSLDDLIKKGLALPNAYDPRFGWVHDGLVALAKECGFQNSFRKEWPAKSAEGINYIVDIISQDIPVIASIKSPTGGHLILLIGFEKENGVLKGFYYHDPDAKDREFGKNKFMAKKDFLSSWKGRIIWVEK